MSEKGIGNKEVGATLREVALLLELKGENPFKVKAYSSAARTIDRLEQDLATMVRVGKLREIPGIGEGLANQITELLRTGKLQLLEDLKSTVPLGHREMLRIPGLGPKKIKALNDVLQIETIGELEYACHENRLAELQGFGQKSQERILQGIQQVKKYQGRHLYGEVIGQAEKLLEKIRSRPEVVRAQIVGSLRRRMEVVKNINLMASTSSAHELLIFFSGLPEVERVQFQDNARVRFTLSSGVEVDLMTTSERIFPFTLYQLTGSLSHWTAMREQAKLLGFDLSDQGLSRGTRSIPCKEEQGLLDALGFDFIPPELREDRGEIEAAAHHQLPRLVEDRDLKGIFHVHSAYSDGTRPIKRMAEAARSLGFSYLGLSDHSRAAAYAGGLTGERLKKQWEEIDQVNAQMEDFHIFKGTESDILPDGSLDYEESWLKQFDFVIASVHSHFTLPKEEMTQRVVKALRNPYTTILGHPTGRLLLAREPYAMEMQQVIDEAAKRNVAIELNAHPFRLDIDWRWCQYAKDKGVKIAINPDAHDEEGLRDTYFGVGIARKGWLEPGNILNTLEGEAMQAFLKGRKP